MPTGSSPCLKPPGPFQTKFGPLLLIGTIHEGSAVLARTKYLVTCKLLHPYISGNCYKHSVALVLYETRLLPTTTYYQFTDRLMEDKTHNGD